MAELQQRQGLAIIVVLAALAAGWWWQQSRPAPVPAPLPDVVDPAVSAAADTAATITVIIEGEVACPGRYAVARGTLLGEAVQQAGGVTAAARPDEPDPYLLLTTDTRIYVPPRLDAARYAGGTVLTDRDLLHVGRTARPSAGAAAPAGGAAPAAVVNLNTATREELMTLPRIGPKTAEAIIAYRDRVGTIRTLDELRNVPRLGDKTLAQLRDRVTF